MAHWHLYYNISFIWRCCDLLFVTFLMEHLLYYMLSTMCCIYWSRRYISGLMMNILIMQTIRPIIAFYFIFLFMLIRHSNNNRKMSETMALFLAKNVLIWNGSFISHSKNHYTVNSNQHCFTSFLLCYLSVGYNYYTWFDIWKWYVKYSYEWKWSIRVI